ncbi:MAG TPA: ArsA family ATPase [Kofleriaceae bacterium]|jgi:anion-transporting  ArsA/GET3 family ATPase
MNLDRRLILVVGKGGVGRSTVAAAIAARLAASGQRTLLYETNANDRFGTYFGRAPVGTEPVQLAPNLFAVNATPASALEEYGVMILRFKSVYDMVFENRVTKAFLRAIPGLDEYALLGKAWFHTTEEKRGKPAWDTVVFDMPASGHSMSMLRIPWVITQTVPDGPLTRDARTIQALLTDPARTAALLVTLAEEMPVNEAIELEGKLTALGIVPQQLVVNQLYPRHFPADGPASKILDALANDYGLLSPVREVASHALLSRDRRLLNERYLGELRRRAKTPLGELPMLFVPAIREPQLAQLGAAIP